jgi:cobalt-zinc-cadmium efflux system membrane fusion protein
MKYQRSINWVFNFNPSTIFNSMKHLYFLLSLVIFLASCKGKQAETTQEAEASIPNTVTLSAAQAANTEISYTELDTIALSRTIKLTGVIDVPPQNMLTVSVPMGGYLKYTKLLPGMHVKKGETLAIVEDQQYIQLQQDYLMTQSKLVFSEKEYERQKALNVNKASSDKVFQMAEADFQQLSILLKSYSEKLKMLGINAKQLSQANLQSSIKVVSPIDGYVSKVNVNIGKYVQASDVMFELVDPRDIHLNLHVFENEINNIYIGQKLKAFTNFDPSVAHLCHVILVGKDFSEQRSVEVHCHFDDYDPALIPGMFMNALLETKAQPTIVLPSASVVSFEGKHYVFVKKQNSFQMLEVETGATEKQHTEIKNPNDINGYQVIEKGAYTLLMMLKNSEED